ncbi:hypothetical protein [Streptomyces roseoverticillatus]|uniref:hypothetical protein n=1 Tax=Streptomyces roseoverticillatus TaxID=66429 RepID=UPI0004BEE7C9|nr:hypothetical protein [Streptomyces roseoverticillatus]
MSIMVRSFDRFGEAAAFDPASGELGPRTRAGSPPPGQAPAGHYGELGGVPVVFYRTAGGLRLRLGERDVAVDGRLDIRHERSADRCLLTVGTTTLTYPAPDTLTDPEDDPTAFAEPEDFDMGLFVANVAGDPGRREAVYR